MKKLFLLTFALLLFSLSIEAQEYFYNRTLGLFMDVGVGPRIPVGGAATSQNLGAGFDVSFSYADNEILPFFLYTTIGYQHFPGKQSFYNVTDYSSFSNNVVNVDAGARYFFPAIMENIVLLMPILEGGISFASFKKLHMFKQGSGKQNFYEDATNIGFH